MPMNIKQTRFQRGMTLIELMIAVAIGIFIMLALVYLISATMRTNTETIRSTHLNQELRSAMQLITRDLRRAGYRYGTEIAGIFSAQNGLTLDAVTGTIHVTPPAGVSFGSWMNGARIRYVSPSTSFAYCIDISSYSASSATGVFVDCDLNTNPTGFPTGTTFLGPGSWMIDDANGVIKTTDENGITTTTNSTCISFGYDRDNDTGNGDIDASEQIGFRLDAANKSLQIGSNGADCATGGGTWVDLISPTEGGIKITRLGVPAFGISQTSSHLMPAGNVNINLLQLQLSLTGEVENDAKVSRTITESVKVRNDQLM